MVILRLRLNFRRYADDKNPQTEETMRKLPSVVALIVLTLALGSGALAQQPSKAPSAARFIGTWKLVAFHGDSASRIQRRGPHPTGLIYYDATGHMGVQIEPNRQRPSWPQTRLPTAQQALDAITGYTAYFGTYSIDEKAQTVTHHREGALNLDVVDYVRRFQFEGNDRLTLLPVDRPGVRLVWERIK